MKVCFLILAALVAAAYAEAPYPPSGYRPAKAFLLPVRPRQQEYGPPPRPVYGPPPTTAAPEPEPTTAPGEEETTTEAVTEETATEEVTTEEATTEEATTEASENAITSGRADQPALYYVLLPDGRLQRVLYSAGSPALGYNAQLRIHDVEPVPPAPVYAYAGPLTRILRK